VAAKALVSFDGEHDLGKTRNGRLAQPITLQFADQLNPARRLCAGLNDSLKPGPVRFE
jgi:hypothetical protein